MIAHFRQSVSLLNTLLLKEHTLTGRHSSFNNLFFFMDWYNFARRLGSVGHLTAQVRCD
jgi:hypothetical protein